MYTFLVAQLRNALFDVVMYTYILFAKFHKIYTKFYTILLKFRKFHKTTQKKLPGLKFKPYESSSFHFNLHQRRQTKHRPFSLLFRKLKSPLFLDGESQIPWNWKLSSTCCRWNGPATLLLTLWKRLQTKVLRHGPKEQKLP